MNISDAHLPEYLTNPPAIFAKAGLEQKYANRRSGKVHLSNESGYRKVFTSCLDVPGFVQVDALQDVLDYLGYHENPKTRVWSPSIDFERDVKVTVLQYPMHGLFNKEDSRFGWTQRDKQGLPAYQGWDKLIYQVEVKEQKFKVVIDLLSVPDADSPTGAICEWKSKSQKGWGSWVPEGVDEWFSIARYSAILAEASGVHTELTDLPGGALGLHESGLGWNASITLDNNAAGHGWYVDATPWSVNDDYLPTSDPNLWLAKPGSGAEGKMDMLSVWLHELGHAAGLDHTETGAGLMGATLLPGQRRLPSTLELQQMFSYLQANSLVQPGSEETVAAALSYLGGESAPEPQEPGAPVRLPSGLAVLQAARSARREGAFIGEFASAANPQLTNPGFEGESGWGTYGEVQMQAGAATLLENATSQTRLNQAFVVGETDRILSFRLSNLSIDDVENAPDDAFEVALINANTGESLLGSTGLTHNDAFLNLQANGQEFKAAQVTTQRNADGSITVVVDLGGVAAGTVASLSFDLIGFGRGAAAVSSHVTVSELRLGSEILLVANSESVSLAEDGVVDIDVMANDEGADRAAVLVELVDLPLHGSVERLANGQVRYKPDANWIGADSFTYRLNDGVAASELATVSITVNAVNDAPVIQARTLTLDEDSEIAINFLAGVSDVDVGDTLTVSITSGPQYGALVRQADGSYIYRPAANYNGNDAVTFEVNDGTLATSSTLALVVNAVNDAPVIAPRTLTLDEDGEQIVDFLAGVSDVDGIDTLTVNIASGPQHGALELQADGSYVHRPAANYNGNDAVTFEVSDGIMATSSTLALVVNAVNDAPVIAPRTLTLEEDGEIAINFLTGVSDVDTGDTLTVSITSGPQHGSLEMQIDGSYIYRPSGDYNGNDAISFEVSDGTVATSSTLAIVVNAVNDAPSIAPRTLTLDEDGEQIINFLSGVSEVDGDPLSVTIVSGPQHGAIRLQPQ